MAKVAIVTDSSACLPAELLRAHRIRIVPLTFLFDGHLHDEGRLSSRDFYALLRASRRFPTTAAPAPAAFLDAFRQAAATAQSALCITLPSAFSGTYSSAVNAAEMAAQELPDFPIRVIDSHCLAMCHGFAVLAAARAAEAGATIDDAEAIVRDVASQAHLLGALDTLRYLAKSGRVPIVLHWATSLLQIKPILAAKGEDIRAVERVRSMPRALGRLPAHIEERYDGERPLHMAVMHADAPAAAHDLAAAVRQRFRPEELLITEFTSVMGAHTGPGFVGVAFFSGEPITKARDAVAAHPAGASDSELQEDVSKLEACLGDIPPPGPKASLVLVSGLPGSGKSYFSRELSSRHPLAHLDSDALRKALFAQPSHSATESARLFAAIHTLLQRLLSHGVSAVLDATSLKETHRQPLYEIAERAGATLIIVQTEAPPAVVGQRLEARARGLHPQDASDATAAVYDRMRSEAEPIRRPHTRVDTSQDIKQALETVLRQMEGTDRA
jgi:DegV family protein with EDD domain